jgi:hypothetical protein
MLPLSHINAKFFLDGDTFEIEHFNIKFEQPTDFRGQPQHEIGGGQLTINISQSPTSSLYLWAKTSTQLKSGKVLFQTDLGMTVLTVEFSNAYCINLSRKINAYAGTNTVIVISPENVKLNGIEHDNFWAK